MRYVVRVALIIGSIVACLGFTATALAYQEPNTLGGTSCFYCHPLGESFTNPESGGDCDACHAPYELNAWTGPHGGYTTTTNKCAACHGIHDATAAKLLPAPTIVATCFTCHDGSGGFGVYGTVEARTGTPPASGHRFAETGVIPGGDGATGGDATGQFLGPGDTLICTDCHSPHGSSVVEAFKGDRRRIRTDVPSPVTSKLLRRQPTGALTPVEQYGSDWCLACHQGRDHGGAVMNHPVDSLSNRPDPFTYSNLAILASNGPTGDTIIGGLGGVPFPGGESWPAEPHAPGSRGYLMPYPRTPEQGDHYPICQQCHEDSRVVGTLFGETAQAAPSSIAAADGVRWDSVNETWTASPTDNPYFQNFPHEAENAKLLVETEDDLCVNCHPAGALP